MYKIEDYPLIKENYYLGSKSKGASKKLCGNVSIISCFMKRSNNEFSEVTLNQYFLEMHKAIEFLHKEAQRYGVKLNIKGYHLNIETHINADPRNGYELLKSTMHLNSMEEIQKHYENYWCVDEAPFLLIFDENNRSFSWDENSNDGYECVNEISIIYKKNDLFNWKVIVHELLHQFGGQDLYYPKEVVNIAKRFLGKSIMGNNLDEEIDDFTAHMIGWKDTISAGTYHFLKNTMWINKKSQMEAIKEAWKEK